ncbi:protein LMBR1L isoform X3 [Dromaius novaehollandiae]|uniref:protein LMBR1L isoform X3 n=1 Tax=Dromaius novaehollandiae TaxID=8790 RepID=UPI00311DE9BB
MGPAEHEALAVRERLFHERVRECVICALLFASLYVLCHFIITHFKKHTDFTGAQDDEDAAVNRIALGLCTFALAVSLGAALLLPFSIASNEVLLSFPHGYYVRWLSGSLVHGLWNVVFLFSNLSLVFLMPFAYLFTESEGFAGSKKGIAARLYETSVVLLLLALLVLGMVWVASAIVDEDAASRESLYALWQCYLPCLHSCVSLLGVLLLLLCTPFGLATMFTITGKLLVKPRLLEDLEEQLSCTRLEEASVSRRIAAGKASCWLSLDVGPPRERLSAARSRRHVLGKAPARDTWVPGSLAPRGGVNGPGAAPLPRSRAGAPGGAGPPQPARPPRRRAAVPSLRLAEEPGLPAGHAVPPGADGPLGARRLLPRAGAAAGRRGDAGGCPGRPPGPGLLLSTRLLRRRPPGRPRPVSLVRGGPGAAPALPPRSSLLNAPAATWCSAPSWASTAPRCSPGCSPGGRTPPSHRSSGTASRCWCSALPCPSSPGCWASPASTSWGPSAALAGWGTSTSSSSTTWPSPPLPPCACCGGASSAPSVCPSCRCL